MLQPYYVPDVPEFVHSRLQQLDPNLGLYFDSGLGCWAVTLQWPANDPRRATIQRGEVPASRAFDILTILPRDCSVSDIPALVERGLRRYPMARADVRKLLHKVELENAAARGEILKPTLELADELIRTNAKTLFRNEGKGLARTTARAVRSRDAQRLREFLHDS